MRGGVCEIFYVATVDKCAVPTVIQDFKYLLLCESHYASHN